MKIKQKSIITFLLLLFIIPLGFYTKFYSGPAHQWVNNSLGGAFYEVFWILLVFLILPDSKPFNIASIVFLATCILEFLQLWHPAFLELIRSDFIGRTVLGNSFNPGDFLYYLGGSFAGFIIIKSIKNRNG